MPRDIGREIQEHPERFDFQDVPDLKRDPLYQAAMDARRPQWLKARLADAKAKTDALPKP